jgi:hypothetical protein
MTSHIIRDRQPNSNKDSQSLQLHAFRDDCGDRLGNTTGIVSTRENVSVETVDLTQYEKKQSSNDRKWTLKNYAEKLMPSTRTSFCMRHRGRNAETVDLYYDKSIKNAHYQGLAHCDNVWCCPVCAATIASKRAAEVQHAVNQWHGSTVMLTLTMRHHAGNDPDEMTDILRDSKSKLFKDRWGRKFFEYIGLSHTIVNFDVTHHDRNGWHIHLHILFFLDDLKTVFPVMDDEAIATFMNAELRPRWIHALKAHGGDADYEHGCVVTAGEQFNREYVAKFGRMPKDTTWTVANELTASTSKNGKPQAFEKGLHPFQILEKSRGDKKSKWGYLWSRYVAFTYRRNQLTWSHGAKAHFGINDLTDEQLMEVNDKDIQAKELVFEIPLVMWESVLHADGRAELLNLCIRYGGNLEELKPYLKNVYQAYKRYLADKDDKATRESEKWKIGTIWDKTVTLHPDERK